MSQKQLNQVRGHLVYATAEGWRYVEDDVLVVEDHDRPCVQCGIRPTYVEGIGWVDECFMATAFTSTLPADVTWACCGHGVEDGYIRWGNVPDHSTDAMLLRE